MHEPFLFEPFERGVHGAGSDLAIQPLADIRHDGAPVGIVTESQDGEEYGLFERSEGVGH